MDIGSILDRFWQRKAEVLVERLVPMLLSPPKIPHEIAWD